MEQVRLPLQIIESDSSERNATRYPNVKVHLVGHDGNSFAIVGRVGLAMRRAQVPEADIKAFMLEATSADLSHLLRTCLNWVGVV